MISEAVLRMLAIDELTSVQTDRFTFAAPVDTYIMHRYHALIKVHLIHAQIPTENKNGQRYSCMGFRGIMGNQLKAPENRQTLQHYGRIQEYPQTGPHYTDRHQSLGRPM